MRGYYIIGLSKMRIFVTSPDATGALHKNSLTIVDISTTNELLSRICATCRINRKSLIAKIKLQVANIRIVQGWPIEHYPLKKNSEILLEVIQESWKEGNSFDTSPSMISSLSKIEQEQELEASRISSFDNEQSFFSGDGVDVGKYFQQALADFLEAVRDRSMQRASQILKEEPDWCHDDNKLDRLMVKKTNFILNELGECGRGALHWAVQEENLQMVQFLLIKSADCNIVSSDEYTPLQLAISLGTKKIFQTLLLDPRINLNKITKKGTALHVAIQCERLYFLERLLDLGADAEIQNMERESALDLITKKNIQGIKNLDKKDMVNIPYILQGKVNQLTGVITTKHKQMTLNINSFTNQFKLLDQNKRIYQQCKVSEISVFLVNERKWSMKNQYSYFQIKFNDDQMFFGFKNLQIRDQWIQQIKKCIQYLKSSSSKKKIRIDQQIVMVLDDTKNQIKHIRKQITVRTPQNVAKNFAKRSSQRMSIFDLTPVKEDGRPNLEPGVLPFEMEVNTSKKLNSNTKVDFSLNQLSQPINKQEQLGQVYGETTRNQTSQNSVPQFKNQFMREISEQTNRPVVCFKDFNILRKLGSGSFGKVFLSRHKKDNKLYALKVLNKKKLNAKKQLKYAVSEATILKKVDCPFIVRLYYSFQTPSHLYLAIDYCPYGDLTELIEIQPQMNEHTARFYIAQIIQAIQYLHSVNILFRDLKPQNILLGKDGYIRLTDFNLSKQNDFSKSFCGSPAYLSPEMLNKNGVGFEADLYGIGCVLYEILTGETPYYDEKIQVLYENIKNGRLKFPSILSKNAKNLISGLLQKDCKKRLGAKSMKDIKNHAFFQGFDWKKLQNKTMQLPSDVQSRIGDYSIQLQTIIQNDFRDYDYESSQSMINRIKNFTFARPADSNQPQK